MNACRRCPDSLRRHRPRAHAIWLTLALLACSPTSDPVSKSTAGQTKHITNLTSTMALDLVALQRSGGLRDLPLSRAKTTRDAVYQGPAHFEGYPLPSILRLVQKPPEQGRSDHDVRFHLVDGRTQRIPLAQLSKGRAVLAVRELGAPTGQAWRPYLRGQFEMRPGPFYLVWDGETAKDGRPWIPHVERISLEDPAPTKSPAFPRHAPKAEYGFRLFRDQCMKCHGMNFTGGGLGPELNVPRNVTEYFEREALRTYIQSPRAISASATMPDFPHLGSKELDGIVRYLEAMRTAKVCTNQADCARFERL